MSDTLRFLLESPWKPKLVPAGEPRPPAPPAPASAAPADAEAPPRRAGSPGPDPAPSTGPGPGPLTGRLLEHFRLGDRLGPWLLGEVYAAHDTALRRPAVVKTVRAELVRDEVQRALFLREARAQAKLVHPHVAQVYSAGLDGGVPFLAVQQVDGGSLADVLDAGHTLGWQEALRHMLAVAEALGEAARLGLVHRDVRPSTILLDRDGEAHLAGFALACLAPRLTLVPPAAASAPTDAPSVAQAYLAPEQLRAEPLDWRADMYGLGATFHHLLSGQPPRSATTAPRASAPGTPAPPLRALAGEVPRPLARVIDRCLAPDRDRRFRSFDDLARALRRAARPPGTPVRAPARTVAWLIDLAPAAVVLRFSYQDVPAAALATALAVTLLSAALLGAPLGERLLRLRLWTARDQDASTLRAALRALLSLGWLLPFGQFLQATYASSRDADAWGIAALAWAGLSLLGSLGALFGRGRTLHDRASGVQVMVDVR